MSRAEHLDRLVSLSLVRICNQDGATLGTGFVIGAGGLIMTCHHVIGERDRVTVHFAEGVTIEVEPRTEDAFAEIDLALLRASGTDLPALPLVPAGRPPAKFWTKGFQFQGCGLTDAVPVDGDITGSSRISYGRGDHFYVLPVLVLSEGDLDEGLSGAPLMDTDSGAVYAVVVAHLPNSTDIGGFALALPQAACLRQEIRGLLAGNDATCPRFGRHLNALGAKIVVHRQLTKALSRLEREGLYLPEKYCERSSLAADVCAFAASDKRVMPIFGEAGVGKTTFLARLAESLPIQKPCLLLRGLAIAPGQRSVADLADAALRGTETDPWPEPPRAEDLAAALRASGRRLWLLLDGLNEHRASARDLADLWIPETIDWLTSHDVRLVVTCRPQLWQLVARQLGDVVFGAPARPSSDRECIPGVVLREFDDDEVRRATAVYDLPELANDRLARHPLSLRLAWELAKKGSHGLTKSGALLVDLGTTVDEFVTHVCKRVAMVINQPLVVSRLLAAVDDLAAELFATRAQEVGSEQVRKVWQRHSHDTDWLDRLVDEHLLLRTPTGYRFAFDDVGEYLQSKEISAADLADPGALFAKLFGEIDDAVDDARRRHEYEVDGRRMWLLRKYDDLLQEAAGVSMGVIAHAYGRLATSGGGEIDTAVAAFCAWLRANASSLVGVPLGFKIAARLGGKRGSPALIRDIVIACIDADRSKAHLWFRSTSERIILPVHDFLDLVRRLLPEESGDWRRQNWQDPRFRRWGETKFSADSHSLARVVGFCLDRDSAATIDKLFTWIGDETKLVGNDLIPGKGTIGDFALASLFYCRRAGLQAIAERVGARAEEGWASALLQTVAETNTQEILEVVSSWVHRPDRHEAAAKVLLHLFHRGSQQRMRVVQLLNRLLPVVGNPGFRTAVASALAAEPKHRERMWPILREAYEGSPEISAYVLEPVVGDHFQEVMILFRARLAAARPEDWVNGQSAWSIVSLLGHVQSATEVRQAVELFVSVLSETSAWVIAYSTGHILHSIDADVIAQSGILDLCGRLLKRPFIEHALTPLVFVAMPKFQDYPASVALRELMATSPLRTAQISEICEEVAKCCESRGEKAYDWLAPFRDKLAPAEWPDIALRAIVSSGGDRGTFASRVEQEWLAQPLCSLTSLARAYLAARRAGWEPFDAALKVATLT